MPVLRHALLAVGFGICLENIAATCCFELQNLQLLYISFCKPGQRLESCFKLVQFIHNLISLHFLILSSYVVKLVHCKLEWPSTLKNLQSKTIDLFESVTTKFKVGALLLGFLLCQGLLWLDYCAG